MENFHFKEDVRDIWIVDIGTIRWDFWSVSHQMGKFSMETVISDQWWRSHQSLACKGFRILRFCVKSWKDESEPNIKYNLGATVGMFQRIITIQNFGHNWRRTDGIRVEYFPRIQYIAARPWSPKVIFMSMFNDIKWWNKDNETECIANSKLVSLIAKRFPARRWSFLGPGQNQSGIPLTKKDQEENGIESLNWWWSNSEVADTQLSKQRVRSLEERSKAKEVENYLYTSVPMVVRLKLFFAQSFLSISSVSTEQSQICVKSTVSVKQERGDLLWQSNPTHCSRQQTYW